MPIFKEDFEMKEAIGAVPSFILTILIMCAAGYGTLLAIGVMLEHPVFIALAMMAEV